MPRRGRSDVHFCHASRSVRITTAILVSNCMRSSQRHSGAMRSIEPGISRFPDVQLHISGSHYVRPGMTNNSTPGVAGPGADHALLAADIVALFRRRVQRTGNVRLHRVTMGAAGIGHVDRQRRAGALHGHGGAFALALLAGRGQRAGFAGIVEGLAIGAAFADRERPRTPRISVANRAPADVPMSMRTERTRGVARRRSTTINIPSPEASPAQIYGRGRFNLVNERFLRSPFPSLARVSAWWGGLGGL